MSSLNLFQLLLASHTLEVIRRQVYLNFALKEGVYLFTSVPKNTFDKMAILLHKVIDVSPTKEAKITQPYKQTKFRRLCTQG